MRGRGMAEGYGTDIYCWDQIVTGRLVSGPELVAQALYRRLTTARGTLRGGEDESVYGFDLCDFIGRVGSQQAIDALPGAIEAELLKDDRVLSVDVAVTPVSGKDGLVSLTVRVSAVLHNETDSFDLTLSVSGVTVGLIGFELT